MKNKFILSVAFLLFSSASFSQITFGVSPGLSFNGAYVGYKIKSSWLIYGGLQFANVNSTFEESGLREGNLGLEEFDDKSSFKGGLYVPNIGFKHYFKQTNKIRPYTSINLTKPLLMGKLKSGDDETDQQFNDAVKNIKLWGGEWGFGTEYFFDENFSIGGEFGIRYLNVKFTDSFTRTVFDPSTGTEIDTEIKVVSKTSLNPTYSRFSLNFYF